MNKKGMIALLVATTIAGGAPLSGVMAAAPASQATQAEKSYFYDLTPAEISVRVGYQVKLPGYFPKGEYILSGVLYSPKQNSASLAFFGLNAESFYLTMWKGDLAKEAVGLTKTSLAKGTAYLGTKYERNRLVWEEEKGVVYELSSDLPVEELKKIAETMGKGDYEKLNKATPIMEKEETIQNPTLEEASKKIGFPIQMPTVLPKGVELRVFSYTEFMGHHDVTLLNKEVGPAIPDVTVFIKKGDVGEGLKEGAGVEKIPFGSSIAYTYKVPVTNYNKPNLTEVNGFTWTPASGIVYTIHSDLPLEEIKKIAASVKFE